MIEWVFHEVVGRDLAKLSAYRTILDKKTGIPPRLKDVTKKLFEDGLLPNQPDFGKFTGWNEFHKLVEFRHGLVHAHASRPETIGSGGPGPEPSVDDLDRLDKGWAANVAVDVIRFLHSVAGTATPSWLVEP